MGWLSFISEPLKAVFGGVKSLVTTDNDRLKSIERMKKLGDDFGKKELDYKIELSKSGNWFTRSVRPMVAYTFLFLYIQTKLDVGLEFSEQDYELFLTIVKFYFGLRSAEKLAGILKKR